MLQYIYSFKCFPYYLLCLRLGSAEAFTDTDAVWRLSVTYIVNIHGDHSYWKQGVLGSGGSMNRAPELLGPELPSSGATEKF